MGGKALREHGPRVLTRAEHDALQAALVARLAPHVAGVQPIARLGNKTVFNDLDLVIGIADGATRLGGADGAASPRTATVGDDPSKAEDVPRQNRTAAIQAQGSGQPHDTTEEDHRILGPDLLVADPTLAPRLAALLGTPHVAVNSRQLSVLYAGCQLDLFVSPAPLMAYRAAFMGYSDLSGLIGTVLRFRGFRLSSQAGLFVFVPSADGATWLPASTDYDAILALFGWDVAAYRRGFADEDDAYAWLEAGAAYTAAPFLDQALATKLDRRWAASRPMYQQYLQRCRAAWKAPPATPGSADGGDVRVVNSPAARPPTAWEERVLKHCDLWPQYTALMADRALLDGFRPRFKASRIARTIDRGYGETARLRRALLAAHGSLRAMATALMPLDDAALAAYYRAAYAPLERSRALPGGNRDGGGVAEGSSSREARHEDPPAEHADRMRSRQDGHRGPECDPGGGDR